MRIACFTTLFLIASVGCGGGGNNALRRAEVARTYASQMAQPSKPLLEYSKVELLPTTMEEEVAAEEAKAAVANQLDERIQNRVSPLLQQWPTTGAAGTLEVRPHVMSLRIVSGGSRFWLGALAGSSHMDVDLILVDKASGQQIGRALIRQSADAMAGGWSMGSTDRNLLNYVADISYAYLRHHGPKVPEPAPTEAKE